MRLAQIEHESNRALMRGGSRTFFAASLLLPARVRAPAIGLYAFCRVADDAIDGSTQPAQSLALLHARLDAIYAGRPGPTPEDRALCRVVQQHGVPMQLPRALLEGFAWDAEGRQYETVDALHDYAARVAGAVGAMMALVMETRERKALARACELGVAMQLTNIARDVGEDARMGRLYLPRQWMQEAGLDPDGWLRAPQFNAALRTVICRLLAEADRLYRRAECGVSALPRDCRPGIQAARLVYAEIGQALAAIGHDAVHQRAVVRRSRQLRLLAHAAAAVLVPPGRPLEVTGGWDPLPAVAFLVDAAAQRTDPLPRRTFYQRSVRMLDLLERVRARQEDPA